MENIPVPVTIYDVAKQANVGVGTVSRVLNQSTRVRAETRQRVLDVIETLDFHPSPLAQRLSRRKTLSIGVIAVYFTRPSVVERLRGIEAVLAASPYDLIVYNVETPTRRDDVFRATAGRVDGLLVISLTPGDDDIARWQSTQTPFVLIDTEHPAAPRIVIDNVHGGYLATKHLLELGHRRIGFVGDPLHTAFNFTSSRDRLYGMERALADYGLSLAPAYVQNGEHNQETAKDLAQQLLKMPNPPTAIFAASDTQALGVMQAARELGLRIPEDLSVIGFDDIEVAEYINLTTIRQPLFTSGRNGIHMLLQTLQTIPGEPPREELAVDLIIRHTTAPPVR